MQTHESDYENALDNARLLLTGDDLPALVEANDQVDQAIAIRPTDPQGWLVKSQVLSAMGDETAALAAAEMTTRRAPKLAEAHYWRATVLADLNRHGDALRSIHRAFRCATPEDAWLIEDLHREKGAILAALGRIKEAVAAFDAGLELFPDSQVLRAEVAPLKREHLRSTLKVLEGGVS